MRTKIKNEIKATTAPYVEIINQIGETFLSPVWSVKEIMGVMYSSQKQLFFQDYINGIAYYYSNDSLDEKDVKTLVKKVSDSNNFETMTSILDSVFFSHSKLSRAILGIITGKFMRFDKLDYEDMVLISAMKDLFDEDLTQFRKYCSYKPKGEIERIVYVENYSGRDRIIIEKLQNRGVLGRDMANRLSGLALRFELTSVSDRLKGYVDVVRPSVVNEGNN